MSIPVQYISPQGCFKSDLPLSLAVKVGKFVFISGIPAFDPSGKIAAGNFPAQMTQIMENIKAIVEAAGAKMEDIVNTTIYMKDISNFAKVNELYGQYFTGSFPARTTIGVANLPGGANIEIAVIAVLPKIRRK